jgi:hypothetical protein
MADQRENDGDEEKQEHAGDAQAPAAPASHDGGDGPAGADGDGDGDADAGKTAPFGWVSLVVIVTLVVGTWFVIQTLLGDSKMQDCIQSGRRNCAPIESR